MKRSTVMQEEMEHVEVIVHDGEMECAPSRAWLTERDVGPGLEQESWAIGSFIHHTATIRSDIPFVLTESGSPPDAR